MSENQQRTQNGKTPPPWRLIWASVYSLVLVAVAGYFAFTLEDGALRQTAFVALAVTLAAVPMVVLLALPREGGGEGDGQQLHGLVRAINTMVQESGLSEGAKRVIHRREEREILRRAIEQDLADKDWDAAMVLVKELAEEFGYRADAEEFRQKIERARLQTQDADAASALSTLDDYIRHRKWAEAYAEAARIQRLFPESHRVVGLRERVDREHGLYRKELERRFLVAAQRESIDDAMQLLKELDQYLAPNEAEPLQEVARGVITKSRENLGVRFKLMLQDHQWKEAIEVGDQIVVNFPNTRMAEEVRGLMPSLRQRVSSNSNS